MEDAPKLQTRYDQSKSTTVSFQEIWMPQELYRFDQAMLSFYQQCRLSGIPFDYLDLDLEDYQSDDRAPLQLTREFIETLPDKWRSQQGVVFIGPNGSGKSFLSFMIAKAAVKRGIRTTCLTLVEYLEKRRLDRVQPSLVMELVGQLNESRLVAIDDFGKEYSGTENWWSYEANTILYNIFSQGFTKSVIMNSAMSVKDFRERIGSANASRASINRVVSVKGSDFRVVDSGIDALQELRVKANKTKCWRLHPILDELSSEPLMNTCKGCKYRFRLKLCYLRCTGKWKSLEE